MGKKKEPRKGGRFPTTAKRVRARIRHAALTRGPVWLSGGRLARSKSVRRFGIVEREIGLPELPDALDGLKITHLSDLHIGDLVPPDHLPTIIDAANDLGGDLIAVTGDFVDMSLKVLDHVIAELGRLEAPLGVYFVPGNHDYLDNGPRLVKAFRDADLKLLVNHRMEAPARGRLIEVAGIDWASKPDELARLVQQTMRSPAGNGRPGASTRRDSRKGDGSGAQINEPTSTPPAGRPALRLLLAHHPLAFDAAVKHGVDLTLAGHTHGGQVVLSNKRGRKGSIGLGSLAHRYPRGLFRRGDSYLYVNSGVGSWFPLRVKCPAEIATLTLKGESDSGHDLSHP